MFLLLLMRDYEGIKLVFTACIRASTFTIHGVGCCIIPDKYCLYV